MVQKLLILFEVLWKDELGCCESTTVGLGRQLWNLRRSNASDAVYIRDVEEHYSLMSHKSNQEQKPKKMQWSGGKGKKWYRIQSESGPYQDERARYQN